MDLLTKQQLPSLELSSQLVAASSETKNAMTSVLLVDNAEDMKKAEAATTAAVERLGMLIVELPEDIQAEMEPQSQIAAKTIKELIAARSNSFRNKVWIEAQIGEMQERSTEIQKILTRMAAEASTNLKTGGDTTIAKIDSTLSNLVDNKFAAMQALLQARAEINLLSGTTFALSSKPDSGTKSILVDLVKASSERLNDVIATLEASEEITLDTNELREIAKVFSKIILQGQSRLSDNRQAVLSARRDADVLLSSAVDDMVFSLVFAAEEVSEENKATIQKLLDNEVGYLNTLLEINFWISTFQMAALDVVVAGGVFETHNATGNLAKASQELKKFLDFHDGILTENLSGLIALADPKMGLPALKTASLQANATAARESKATAEAVLAISKQATALGQQNLEMIAGMAQGISTVVQKNQQWVQMLLAGSAGVLLLALILTRVLILIPLRSISKTTERLAEGDLAEVTGFEKSSDEIHRISQALAIFRNGLVERQELAARTEKEREERAAEQKAAVDAIGDGLERLSNGDLSKPIRVEMANGYEKLRDNFNSAQLDLRNTLEEVINAVSSIRNGTADISTATGQLSQRTESQAATLEETAAALDEMTSSVRSSADDARNVEETMQKARHDAEESGVVVNSAVAAMTEIDRSSTQITKIVNVIDDIAFQTNLLALNAGVEAARAGESGKGFAVVASEVRALAQRSAESAKEIKTLINDSSEHVERGVELVGKTGDALTSILDRFTHISQLVSSIAKVTAEQSAGLNEINTGITQLDRVTQQNASMVEETTEAGQMLKSDATRMGELAAQFEIGSAEEMSVDRADQPDFSSDLSDDSPDEEQVA
ncbi:methyl-accepting chemotaxis protein [uncultured Pelagimonas sp.]|uniref:methyl-accepting chemotaxis protein n=1 Tax=uncultured Pelagimonas sp. TaxID=1618102 RepID=UPI002629D542|nr:methyl-accepting chemotaxis protein [uncultured Pelagimonas sp.]